MSVLVSLLHDLYTIHLTDTPKVSSVPYCAAGAMGNPTEKACLAIILAFSVNRKVKRKRWVKEWLKKRDKYTHINLVKEIVGTSAADDYRNYFRMNENSFNELLSLVAPYLTRQNTVMRDCLSVQEKLCLTLRYLATGRTFEDLKFSVIISPSAISQAVLETCEALVFVLQECMKMPSSIEEWKVVAHDFGTKFKFWNCIGAIDDKHVAIKKPMKSGSGYFNYKGFFSIVLLAVVNAHKEFLMVDVGINGRISDGGVLFHSIFYELLEQNKLQIPSPSPLPNTDEKFPFMFIGDEAFALSAYLMKPYSQKTINNERAVFNKRLSGARSVVENAFGILVSRFGVLAKPINLEPLKASKIVLACCYLHNFLMRETENNYLYSSEEVINDSVLQQMQRTNHKNNSMEAKNIRDAFCRYYCNQQTA